MEYQTSFFAKLKNRIFRYVPVTPAKVIKGYELHLYLRAVH
jgi:hypothetical protein